MALQYVTVQEKNWAGGLDAASSPTAIPQGYVEECVNMIPREDGQLVKRPGYVTVGGGLPFRVSRIETTASGYILNFQSGINLVNVRSVPLLVCGRVGDSDLSHDWGDFSYDEESCVYYTTSSEDPRRTVLAGNTTTISLLADESGVTSVNIIPQISESLSLVSSDLEIIYPTIQVSNSTFDVSTSIVNGTAADKYFFMYVLNTETSSLSSYIYTSAGDTSHSIPQATHALPNSYILVRCYDANGYEVNPTVSINRTTFEIKITDLSSIVRRAVMVSCEDTHFKSGTIGSGETNTITLTGLDTPYAFIEVYVENGAVYERCVPNSILVDADTLTATVSFTNGTDSSASFIVYWTSVDVTARVEMITAVSSPDVGLIDTKPALSVYGLDQETAYLNAGTKAGHVVCVDNYKVPGDEHLIASLGGVVYKLQTLADLAGSIHSLPTWYPAHRGRVNTTVKVGPVFSNAATLRTNGCVAFDEATTSGYATASSLNWDSTVLGGSTKITITATNLSTYGTPIRNRTDHTFADYLTISQAPYKELEGTWEITKVEYGASTVTLWIDTLEKFNSSDYDLASCAITCGIFSDSIPFTTSTVYFRAGDELTSTLFGANAPICLSWEGGSPTSVRFKNITSLVELPAGLQLVSKRSNSKLIQLQTLASVDVTPANLNLVVGDMLSITGYDRQFRVTHVRCHTSESVLITCDGITATLTAADTTTFTVGQQIVLYGSRFGGVHTITAIPSNTTMQFASSETGTGVSSTMPGIWVEVDEEVPEVTDNISNTTTISVHSRWLAVEAPYGTAYTDTAFTVYNRLVVVGWDESTDIFTTSTVHGFRTGNAVRFSYAATPPGLLDYITYYAIVVNSTTFKIATSQANAFAGTQINMGAYSPAPYEIKAIAQLTTSTAHKLTTGLKVRLYSSNGAFPTPLNASTDYYVISNTDTTFLLAASLSDALSGTAISYTSAASGILYVRPAPVNEAGRRTYFSYFPSYEFDEQLPIRSCMAGGNMYLTNGVDFVMKYDGQNIMRAGIPRWQPFLFGVPSYDANYFIQHKTAYINTNTSTGNSIVTSDAGVGSTEGLLPGRKVFGYGTSNYTAFAKILGVTTNETSSGTTQVPKIRFDRPVSFTSNRIDVVNEYKYYFRHIYVDDNDTKVITAATGISDTTIYQLDNSQILLKYTTLPAFASTPLDYSRLEMEIFRTKADEAGPFYRVANKDVSFVNVSGYTVHKDYISDDLLTENDWDAEMVNIAESEVLTGLYPPPVAKYITSATNRLLLANLEGPSQVSVRWIETKSTPVTTSDIAGLKFILRKDNTSTSSTCDLDGVWVYEFVSSTQCRTISAITSSANGVTVIESTDIASYVDVGDWVYIAREDNTKLLSSLGQSLSQPGWFRVVAVSGNYLTIETPEDTTYSIYDATRIYYCSSSGSKNIPIVVNKGGVSYTTTASQSQYVITLPTVATLMANTLAMAINATQRMCSTSQLSTTFEPWVSAFAGADYPSGTLVLEIPCPLSTTPEIQLLDKNSSGINSFTFLKQFVNGLSRTQNAQVSFSKQLFPARVAVSMLKFPEVFDNPYTDSSRSIADINPEDGQEITGMIPLFSTSAFTASSKDASVVVFKERSIYILNPETRAVRRLETDGIGCRYPYSISPTRGGVMFANEAGVFRLNYDLTVEMLGKALGDEWDGNVEASLVHGHHFSREQQYKISTTNDVTWVYNYRGEEGKAGIGGWSKYTNHPVTGWCNQGLDEFFGSTIGRVFKTRYDGDTSDYRDDDMAIDAYTVFRPMDFGESGTRKQCRHLEIGYLTDTLEATGNRVYFSLNLNETMTELSSTTTTTSSNKKADVRQYGLPSGRFMWLQLKVRNATIDEPLEIVSLAYRVVGLSDKRNPEAGN